MRILATTTLAILVSASLASAQPGTPNTAYRYVDERGVIHWAQSLHLVPPDYAARATTPSFSDPIFPTPAPYMRPATPTALSITFENEAPLRSLEAYADGVRRYLTAMWKGRGQDGPQPTISFYIERDGRLSIPDTEHSSGDAGYDLKARDTIINVRRFPPLPKDFPKARVLVHLRFGLIR
jgi:TonB family protein